MVGDVEKVHLILKEYDELSDIDLGDDEYKATV